MSLVRTTLLALAAAGLVAAPSAAQQLYKYTGPDGKVQYSDRPPADGGKAEKITGRLSSLSPAPSAAAAGSDAAKASGPKSPAEQEQEFRKRRLETQEKAAKDAKLAEEKRGQDASCAAARRELSSLQSGARVARLNEQGERVFLEDNGIQQEAQRLQREIANACK